VVIRGKVAIQLDAALAEITPHCGMGALTVGHL